jgi:hypothetical protein
MIVDWKGFGRERPWPNFKVLSRHLHGELRKTTQNLNQDSRDLNPRPPENEAGVLTTRPRRSVVFNIVWFGAT